MGEALDRPLTDAMRLGSYEILGKLARGGMAELFLATTPEPDAKIVVIKKILPKYAANQKFVKLFLDEARLASGLHHPHIAQVYDLGGVDGDYFFAMEYVHGKDVRSTMRRITAGEKRFPIEYAVMIARNTAAALHYAHEQRRPDGTLLDIVHRDVSPSNILISYEGEVKLVDFGVAKAASNSARTRTGTLKGKIAYMSPEQARGAPLDRRSDVFSLGIVLWEMVTSHRLYRTDNDLATIQLIVNSKPQPPTELAPDCPPELERIVLKALAASPTDRYQTAEELQRDLDELVRARPIPQSTTALRDFMHKAFEAEIDAWREAQEGGHTVMDAAMFGDSTMPVSDAEIEHEQDYADEDPDPDEDDPESSVGGATADLTTPIPPDLTEPVPEQEPPAQVSEPPTAKWAVSAVPAAPPSVVVGRLDQTPVPTAQLESPFPRAPKEWLPPKDPVVPPDEPMLRHWRNIKIGAAVILVLIVLIAVIFSGGGAPHTGPAPMPVTRPAP